MSTLAPPAPTPATSAWAPFRYRVFTVVWFASLVGNIGTWMRDVGAGWLMTTLSTSSVHVALVQAATTLPIFLLSLPAGALADIVNRRRFIIAANVLLAVVAVGLAVATQRGAMTPWLLIGGLLVGGVCTALLQPMQQSLTPLLAPREHLSSAIALNSMGINVARAIGPALAGVLIGIAGVPLAFYADAASYVAVVLAFLWWTGASQPASQGAPERLLPAMQAGLRYVWHSAPLQRVLLRAASFFLFASCYWALLPLLARRQFGGDAGYYGLLLGCVGAGAVAGALVLPRLRARLGAEGVLRTGQALTVAVLLVLALASDRPLAAVAMVVAGLAWIGVLTTANVAAQTALPNWVRGRGLAIYLMVFSGAMAAGSVGWGLLADATSLTTALLCAAGLGVLALGLAGARPLLPTDADLAPAGHWAPPLVADGVLHAGPAERGPVMVTIDYQVEADRRRGFLALLRQLRQERLRDGAYTWGVYEDAAAPGRFVECFFVASWEEHLRQHHRVSRADADLQAAVRAFHAGEAAPRVGHFIAPA